MKILFLDFDGVLNEDYPNNKKHEMDYFEEEYELYKKCNNFIYEVLNKYEFDNKHFDRPPSLCMVSSIDYDKVQWLNKIVRETGCKIVVSSSWRGDGIENLALYLTIKGFKYPESLISVTGVKEAKIRIDNEDHHFYSCRGAEIKDWLDITSLNYGEIESFAILDDEKSDIITFFPKEFVQVKGLNEVDANRVIKILNTIKIHFDNDDITKLNIYNVDDVDLFIV